MRRLVLNPSLRASHFTVWAFLDNSRPWDLIFFEASDSLSKLVPTFINKLLKMAPVYVKLNCRVQKDSKKTVRQAQKALNL